MLNNIYISRQQSAADNYMHEIYSIIVEGYIADLQQVIRQILKTFASHDEIIAAAKKVIPNLPENQILYSSIYQQFQDE
jgi:hypothetical protein